MDEKEAVKTEKKKINKVTYLVTGSIFLVIALVFMWNDGIFEKEGSKEVIGSISNGFFIAGGLFTTISSYHIVSDNPEIADIKFRMAGFNMLRYPAISIKAKKEGTVKFHLENK